MQSPIPLDADKICRWPPGWLPVSYDPDRFGLFMSFDLRSKLRRQFASISMLVDNFADGWDPHLYTPIEEFCITMTKRWRDRK